MAVNIKKELSTRNKPNLSTLVYGKVPPQAPELEEAVLGACMLEKNTFEQVMDIIYSPDCFYVDAHRKIWEAMINLYQRGDMIDLLTITEQLRKENNLEIIGGQYFLNRLSTSVMSSAHVQAHSFIVVQKFMQREAIRICGDAIGEAYEDSTDVFDLLDGLEANVKNITAHIVSGDNISLAQSFQKVQHNYHKQKEAKSSLIGVSSGLSDFDAILMGWRTPTLNLLGAFPSFGKTALMLQFLKAAALNKIPSKVYSLETGDLSLTTRLIASLRKIPLEGIMKGQLNKDQEAVLFSAESYKLVASLNISISQKTFYIEDIERSARKAKKNNPQLGLIALDFIQLVKMKNPGKRQRDEIIGYIARQLKLLSAEIGVPIIALSQLTRDALGGKDKKPQLTSLAGSRELEWNADTVTFIHYENKEPILILAKNKDGKCDQVKVKFDADIQLWTDYNDVNQNVLPGIFKTNTAVNNFSKSDWEDTNQPF